MNQWHPSSDQLIEYSAGSGSTALNILISAHLHFCAKCRAQVSEYQSTAAVVFEEQKPVGVETGSFARLMESIKNSDSIAQIQPIKRQTPTRFPPVVEKLIHHDTESLDWKRPMKNLRVSHLLTDDQGCILGLHHMKSGGRVPHHAHRGDEISVVIEGGFSDELGSYRPGDFIHLANEHRHSPQVDADGDCWMLTAVVAPIQLTGPLGWLINPFLKA